MFLAIIGDASTEADARYVDELKRLTRTLDLGMKVIFQSWVEKEELWKIFGAADLVILPSLKEGMPNVLLEALGCDIPCFGSNIPGIRDILCHDELMFDPGDEEALAEKISRFFSDVHQSVRIIQFCRERKKKFIFDWKQQVFQLVAKGTASADKHKPT